MFKRTLLLGVFCVCTTLAFSQQEKKLPITCADSIVVKTKLVKESGSVISELNSQTPLKQPIGLAAPGSPFTIIIDKIYITEKGGFLDASVAVEIPGSTTSIAFKGSKIPFSAQGGLTGSARLELAQPVKFKMLGGADLEIKNDGKTFVEFDCNGFKLMGLSADLLLDPNLLMPADSTQGKQLKGHIETVIKDANDILASVTLPAFKIKGVNDFIFTVNEATWDQSDMANPSGFSFPATYTDPLYSSNPTLWRGFHFKSVSVQLPTYLNGNAAEPIVVSATNFLYDDTGVSGTFGATSVLSLDKGKIADGFALSVQKIGVELTQNRLTKGNLEGAIRLPISTADTLGYKATADVTGKFIFTAITKDTLKVDLWKANAKIYPSSSVTIENQSNGLTISVLLNGIMTFDAPVATTSAKKLTLKAPFEELFISNKAPYFTVKAFGIDDLNANYSLSGFSFTLNSLSVTCQATKASVSLDMNLAIGGSKSNAFSAGGNVIIKAAKTNSKWGFDGVGLDKFSLATEFSGFKINGKLAVFNDSPQYGDGVSGSINLTITKLDFTVSASAIFGKVDGYKYWYADAFATVNIPIVSGLSIVGLGGGAFCKMRQGLPTTAAEDYGRAESGICYVPSEKISFGFMAKVALASSDGKLVNADVALEMAFNANGGISYISFLGHAKILAVVDLGGLGQKIKEQSGEMANVVDKCNTSTSAKNGNSVDGGIEASANEKDMLAKAEDICAQIKKKDGGAPISVIMYSVFDFDNHSFFSKMDATIAVGGVLQGGGEMVMYFAPNKWYIKCGTPKNPIFLELLSIAKTTSYFMMGHDLPGFPSPPKNVCDILKINSASNSRDISSLEGGKGVAFGASLEIDTGDLQFLMFYARFAAGMGFDVMLKNFGASECAGRNGRIGLNGWYAMGQSWAYVKGDVGIRVKMRFIKGKFPILSIAAATLLEAQLPNPAWFHGVVGGNYNILGGLVKGNCRFEFEMGEKCKVKSSAKDLLADLGVISDVKPSGNSNNINVFTKPQLVLNMPVERAFVIDAPDGSKYKFRAKLDNFVTTNGTSPIVGVLQYNEDSTVVTLKPHSILPEQKSLTTSAKLYFEEYKNGKWERVKDNGVDITETKSVTYTTGDAPDYILPENVDIEYPVRDMKNFYKDEYGKGFVVLDMWQDNLFDAKKFKPYTLFKAGDQVVAKVEVTTNYDKKEINFDIPQSLLTTNTNYKMVLVNEPVDKNTNIDKNVEKRETQLKESEGDVGEMTLTAKEAKTELVLAEDKELYTVVFRTSMYKKLVDKIRSYSLISGELEVQTDFYAPSVNYTGPEFFDEVEMLGLTQTNNAPLVNIRCDITSSVWYTEQVKTQIYDSYPFLNIGVVSRSIKSFGGIPPNGPIVFKSRFFSKTNTSFNYFDFLVPYTIGQDYFDVKNKMASIFINRSQYSAAARTRIEQIVSTYPRSFYSKSGEQLKISFYYLLPNKVEIFSGDIIFNYYIYK